MITLGSGLRALLMVLWAVLMVAGPVHAATADAAPPPTTPPTTDDPSCVLKRPSNLCAMADGGGGVCTPTRCASGQPCLQCVAAPLNSPETRSYTMFIVVGTLIFLGGMVFVFRLRKNWK